MIKEKTIQYVQQLLKKEDVDGWLIYDFRGSNPLAWQLLEIPKNAHLTRRLFYWIPKEGDPIKLVHRIESDHLDHCMGKKNTYLDWKELHQKLGGVLQGCRKILMEFSPLNAVPTVSYVDGGMVDLVRSLGMEILSSGSILQFLTATWSQSQYHMHKEAMSVLEASVQSAWDFIAGALKGNQRITEYDVQKHLLLSFQNNDCVTEGAPICAVNDHAADPHFSPDSDQNREIKEGDLILIDLWCKKNLPEAVFADITKMAVAAKEPTQFQKDIFALVRQSQREATEFVTSRFAEGKSVAGYEVDQVARNVIKKGGYDNYFLHRTGHNIDRMTHGPGANIDSLETQDTRLLIPRTCFSIEPGIYLPNQFGIRLEYDVFIHENGHVEVTGTSQEKIQPLF